APNGIADSKLLSALKRERLAGVIRARSLAWAVAWASVEEIDSLNILQASLLAMRRAVGSLGGAPDEVLLDGSPCPPLASPALPAARVSGARGGRRGRQGQGDLGGVDPREDRA